MYLLAMTLNNLPTPRETNETSTEYLDRVGIIYSVDSTLLIDSLNDLMYRGFNEEAALLEVLSDVGLLPT